jgi:hypothetical protein
VAQRLDPRNVIGGAVALIALALASLIPGGRPEQSAEPERVQIDERDTMPVRA